MPTPRDKLIADWKGRLAAAEAIDLTSPSRPAWLARLQIRLYRFLLAIYGDSDWTTNPPPRTYRAGDADGNSDSVVFDSPDALPLSGKPAKSVGQIQAVLKSVSNAQSQAPESGPLVQGVTEDCWVTLALVAKKDWPKISRSADALRRQGFESRLQYRGGRYSLEVRARDRQEATRALQALPPPTPARASSPVTVWRTARSAPVPFSGQALVIGLVIGPLVGYLAVLWVDALVLHQSPRHYDKQVTAVFLIMVWVAAAVIVNLICTMAVPALMAIPEILSRIDLRRRRFATRTMTWRQYAQEFSWNCVAAGVIIGPIDGLTALAIAGNVPSLEKAVHFLAGWWLSVLAAAVLYLIPQVRWLIPWLQ